MSLPGDRYIMAEIGGRVGVFDLHTKDFYPMNPYNNYWETRMKARRKAREMSDEWNNTTLAESSFPGC